MTSLETAMLTHGFNKRGDRQKDDFYATPPEATEQLLEVEKFNGKIYEPCCGQGHISKVLIENGYDVESTDLVDRGYGQSHIDFLMETNVRDNIITNPPYGKLLIQFLNHTQLIADKKICLLLKLQALEGIARGEFYKTCPPVRVHVFSKRVSLMKNGDSYEGGMMALAWFVWEKGNKDKPVVSWL